MTGEPDDLGVRNATVLMHPHPTEEREFSCFCSARHVWGEPGMGTFMLPIERWKNYGFQMIKCRCNTWHMKYIGGQEAENIIKSLL